MVTIFDYNPTDDELDQLAGGRDLAEAVCGANAHPDGQLAALARLMHIRGEEGKVRSFLKQIEDPEYRFDIAYTLLPTAQ